MRTIATGPLAARRGDPKGQVLVLFALVLVVLLLVSALAVDYGGWLLTRRNYQNTSDAAALAGAQFLTRSENPGCVSKNFCARQAAWESVMAALGLTALNPAAQATGPSFQNPYQENGYSVWVASPPADAGAAYLGHVSGPGVVYVRIDHAGASYLSRMASINRNIIGWATAGRFPANFAVIGMCSPDDVTERCLAGDSNIKIDGTNSNLIVETGDLGTNRWTKTGGNTSGIALGNDSNAYMQLYDTCWKNASNQCQLWGWDGTIDTSTSRSAIPLGAPVQDPNYLAPTISGAATPNQCLGSGAVQLASAEILERDAARAVADLPIRLAAVREPTGGDAVLNAANVTVSGVVKAQVGGAPIGGIVVTPSSGNGSATTNASGQWSMSVNDNGSPFTFTATDPTDVYHTTTTASVPVSGATAVPEILMPKNPVVSGRVTSSNTGLPLNNVQIAIQAIGTNYTTTTDASGNYSKIITIAGNTVAYAITGTRAGYTSNGTNVPAPTAYDTNYPNNDFQLTVIPASITGTVTDKVTGLPIPGVTVSLSTGQSAVTDSTGTYDVPAANVGSVTFTLTGTATPTGTTLDGYLPGDASSSHPTPYTTTVAAGSNTGAAFNFALWPKGCKDANGDRGDWSCQFPSGNYCGAVTNVDGPNVTCNGGVFTQAFAIRPGTYNDITIPNNACAWLDPRGGVTGLAGGQSGGIYHIKGTISIGNGSYLFGDGVTLVFDRDTDIDVGNGGGFVLNYGSVASGTPPTCDFFTVKKYNDGFTPCFRTVPNIDGEDYAYAAWTTKSQLLWSGTQAPVYSDDAVAKGSELGITFFMWCPTNTQCGLGNHSRMKLATASMGYLFNGVLYGPNDDIQLGGGKDGQTAAGQLVGWTIEYHGGTRILQNWYGDPVDGQPFLIEPVLGE